MTESASILDVHPAIKCTPLWQNNLQLARLLSIIFLKAISVEGIGHKSLGKTDKLCNDDIQASLEIEVPAITAHHNKMN